jgi:hypothetical protein
MAPTTPTLLAILLHVQASLQAIAAGGTPSYFTTVKPTSVILDAVGLDIESVTECPFIVLGNRIEVVAPRLYTSRPVSIKVQRRIILQAALDAPGEDYARKSLAIAQFVADVEVALTQDLTRGGLALDTRVEDETAYMSFPAQSRCYVEIPVEVTFGRKYGQP